MVHEVLDAPCAPAEMPLQTWPHDSPAQPRPITHGTVGVLDAYHLEDHSVREILECCMVELARVSSESRTETVSLMTAAVHSTNVLGRPVLVPTKSTTSVGSAIFAFMAAGAFKSVEEAQAAFSPDPARSALVFLKDSGGNENAQLYYQRLGEPTARLLTDGKSVNGAPLWSNGGREVAFFSTGENCGRFSAVM